MISSKQARVVVQRELQWSL